VKRFQVLKRLIARRPLDCDPIAADGSPRQNPAQSTLLLAPVTQAKGSDRIDLSDRTYYAPILDQSTRLHGRLLSVNLLLVAACALVDDDGRVLIAQRPAGRSMAGLWEFPGGKVEPGERPEDTLIRELNEELSIIVQEACLAPLTFASHAYPDFHLLMPLYVCRRWEGIVTSREGQVLTWVKPNRLRDYPMPPADVPLIPHLMTLL
jgi:8-oxo-dGTP diphosphatase